MTYEQIVAALAETIAHSLKIHASPETAARSALAVLGPIVAEDYRQIAQMVHNAYHGENLIGTWRDCPMAACQRARDATAALGIDPTHP